MSFKTSKVRLGDIGVVFTGKTPSSANPEHWGNEIDFITPSDFGIQSRYVTPKRRLSRQGGIAFQRITVPPKSIMVTCIGSDMGKVAITQNDTVTNQQINTIRPIMQVDSLFLYYKLVNARKLLRALAEGSGSTMPIINKSTFENISFDFPKDKIIQEKIAKILGDLDRKIELNRQMNATLEQIGQTLFKKYFVDNPESEEWENVQLGNYVELVNGATYKSSELSESDCALLTLKNFKRKGGFKREGYKQFTGKFKDEQVVQDGDLVVAHTDLTQQAEVAGVPALVSGADDFQTVGISMDVVKIIPKEELINSGFLYFLMMSHEFQSYKMGYITGSTVLHLNKKCIPNFTFKLPDEKTLQTLSPVFKEIIFKMTLNDSEIDSLEKTRDSVLPKLMSGEIKV